MATQIYFNEKLRKLPGAYSRITSGEQNQPASLDYGKIMIIDTGLGAGWGGGAGIAGTLATGMNSVYQFTDIDTFKTFLKGGMFWKLAEPLFFPYQNMKGVSTIYFAKAAETVPASMTFTATGGGANGGTFKVKCKDEGVVGNGVKTGDELTKGYAFSVTAGVRNTAKFLFKIWVGQFRGLHTDNLGYNEVAAADTKPFLIVQSPEFNNITELITWANSDTKFGTYFEMDATSAIAGSGVVTAGDIPADTYNLAVGGTETYNTTHLAEVLDAIGELDYQFVLCDKYGITDYDAQEVTDILAHINDGNTFIKTLVIGGGHDEDEFADTGGSIDIAAYFNSNRVILVHGGVKTTTQSLAGGYRIWPSLYHAAVVLGRMCGLAPQVPITNKLVGVDGLVHNMKTRELESALDSGILVTTADQFRGGFKILQGVNTLQDNTHMFNNLGQSHSVQFERIVAQINRELVVNSQLTLLNMENGVNVNSLSEGVVKSWTETYLQSRVATIETDNLLLSFRNVTVTRTEDYYHVTYGIVVNNEITKIFYTGYLFRQ